MSETHVYLPVRHEVDEDRIGFIRKPRTELTVADQKYVDGLNTLKAEQVLTELRHSPELKALIKNYLNEKDVE